MPINNKKLEIKKKKQEIKNMKASRSNRRQSTARSFAALDRDTALIKSTVYHEIEEKKHPSWMTVFSCWNTMIGSGVMTLPWAFSKSGIVMGVLISFVSFAFSARTCILSVIIVRPNMDFYDTMK